MAAHNGAEIDSTSTAGGPDSILAHSLYFPISVESIQSAEIAFDLYIKHNRNIILYRSSGESHEIKPCAHLREQGITYFYVPIAQHSDFQRTMCEQMTNAFGNAAIGRDVRTDIVRGTCSRMIDDFMQNPSLPGIGDSLRSIASQFSEWCSRERAEFEYLLDMSEHDFYTTTHMVNVGIGCTLLGAEILGEDNELVQHLTLGGLIHDVGKCGVPAGVLNKEGKLTDDEWALIRDHPLIGAEVLQSQSGISDLEIDMTLNHHERLDGRGYPNGISGDQISFPARVCSIVDVYDALTSARPYRSAIPPRAVLVMMREDVGTAFDPNVFDAWECVVERMLDQDPERAIWDNGQIPENRLDAILPSINAQLAPGSGSVTIRCFNGMTAQGEIVAESIAEIVVRCCDPLQPGTRVTLSTDSGLNRPAQYISTRLGSKGESQMVFKLTQHN